MTPSPSSDPTERAVQAVTVVLAALVAITCAASGEVERITSPRTPVATPSLTPSSTPSADLPSSPPTQPSLPPAEAVVPELPLDEFYAALRDLENDQRQESVRIAWFGDSHTAADFMTHEVRKRFQGRFGNGGPGFVRMGVIPYRHGTAKIVRKGQWRRLPLGPATETPTDDGVFGLGGMRSMPVGHLARWAVELYDSAVPERARYELTYRLPTTASGFEVIVDDQEPEMVSGADGSGEGLSHLELWGAAGGELEVKQFTGSPELFSVIVESGAPGLVLDTIGIDGARVGTPLAWDGATWVEELAHRRPDLVVLSFGTNEVYQEWPTSRYVPQYDALLARIESAVPSASCLLLGPSDVLQRGGTNPRVLEIEAMQRAAAQRLGCGYISLVDSMGGEGSYHRWMTAEPRLAAGDGVHLSRAGYEKLGQTLADQLLNDYSKFEP